MNREQMEAHLTLHDWHPCTFMRAWVGIGNRDSGLVFVRIDKPIDLGPAEYSPTFFIDVYCDAPGEFLTEWSALTDEVLALLVARMQEGGL